jgi:hypothetical protein
MTTNNSQLKAMTGNASPPTFLRLAAGTVYFYFGFLKFFPDLSPAELLAGQTIMRLSHNMVDAQTALFYLAILECSIGLSFLFNAFMRYLFFVFLFHQASTFLPLFIFPEITFKIFPFAPTLEGQYIMKNLISVAAGWTVMLPAAKAHWAMPRKKVVIPLILATMKRRKPVTSELPLDESAIREPAVNEAAVNEPALNP